MSMVHKDRRIAALVALSVGVVYVLGACRTIYVGDSGELVTAVGTLGIPHPSGYPLYVLLGKLWTLLCPVGSVAFRMSLFSAVAAALACAAMYRLCRELPLPAPASLFAAYLLAFSGSFWSQANIQRVYTLNALFVVLATGEAFRWYRRRDSGALLRAYLLCGLGACNHTFLLVFAVALTSFALWTARREISLRPAACFRALRYPAVLALGLLPYLYLPMRSRMDPRLDWGNPETLQAFWQVVSRQSFWERRWFESSADLLPVVADFLRSVPAEFTVAGAVLAAIGVAEGFRRGYPVLLPVLVVALNVLALALHGSRSDIFIWHRYYIPAYTMSAILAGVAWSEISRRMPKYASYVVLVLPLFLLIDGYARYDRSRFAIAEDFARSVFESLPPGAHLIASDDNVLFALIYLHLVEGERPDVDLVMQGVGDTDLPPLRFDPEADPLFFTHHPNWNLPTLDIVPIGAVYRAWPRGKTPPELVIPRRELAGENDDRVPKDYLTQNLLGHHHFTLGFAYENRDWPRAVAEFERAEQAAPDNDVLFYNLGLVFARNGLYDDALAAFERSAEINPRHLASRDEVRATDRIEEVTTERARIEGLRDDFRASLASLPAASALDAAGERSAFASYLDARGEAVAARGLRLQAEMSR